MLRTVHLVNIFALLLTWLPIQAEDETARAWASLAGQRFTAVRNVVYRPLPDGDLKLDLYVPYDKRPGPTVLYIYGGGFKGIPGLLTGSVKFAGVGLSEARLVAFAVAIGVSLAVLVFLRKSLFGKAIRAVSQEPEIASISGISVASVRNATFALGAAMAGLAGVLLAPIYAADPQMGSRFLIKVFAVVVVGGMGSYGGAIAGALLLGVVEVLGGYSLGQMAGSAAVYLVMIAVLLVRPRGLFGVGVRA